MAHHQIGRNDDHRYPLWETPTDDEDKGPDESSSSSSANISYFSEVTTIPIDIPTPISYPSDMSNGDELPNKSKDGPPARPYTTGPPHWVTGGDNEDNRGPPRPSTTLTSTFGEHYDTKTTTATSTPRLVSTDHASSPLPTNDNPPSLQNHRADNGPDRTPMYAAAGSVPVVVIVIGFFVFFCLRKRRRQRQAAAEHGHIEEMKMHPKPVTLSYIAPTTPTSTPQAILPQYSLSTPSSSHPPTASSSQPVILGPIPSGNNGAYLTGMDTSDLVSMTSAGGVSRQGTIVDRDPFADGRSLEEAPPPYRPSSLPPASLASISRNSSVRMAAPSHMTSRTQLIERSPFDDPEDDEVSELSGPTLRRATDAMSEVSDLSYQVDPVVGRSPF